jgi:hypothetical protein
MDEELDYQFDPEAGGEPVCASLLMLLLGSIRIHTYAWGLLQLRLRCTHANNDSLLLLIHLTCSVYFSSLKLEKRFQHLVMI